MRNTAIILCAVVLLCGCSGRKTDTGIDLIHNTQTIDGTDSSEKVPVIQFDNTDHDFGRLTASENVSYSFHFKNVGKSDLVIASCSATCGCTVADYPRERIAPGKDGYVKVSFKSAGMSGRQVKEVTVSTNGTPAQVKLRIMAEVVF